MNIIHITPFYSPNTGGVETFLDNLNQELIKKHKITVLTYSPLTTKTKYKIYEKIGNLSILRIPYPGYNLFYKLDKFKLIQTIYLTFGLMLFSPFFLLFINKKNTILNSHGISATIVGAILSKLFNLTLVTTIHTNYKFKPSWQTKLITHLLNTSKSILADGQGTKTNLLDIGITKPISTYFNWIDETKYNLNKSNDLRKKYGYPQDDFIGLFVGRFSKEKGIDILIQSIPQINKNIKIIIIGSGPGEEEIKNISAKYNNVKYLGRVNENVLIDHYHLSTCMLFAQADTDYFARTSIEALSSGLPILLTKYSTYHNSHNLVTIKLPKDCGEILDIDPKSFVQALNQIYLQKKYLFWNPSNCQKYIQKIYSKKKNYQVYLDCLKNNI